jgi:hypothetical protein
MTDATEVAHQVFTATSAFSLAAVAGIAVIAETAARKLLPKNASWQNHYTFVWLVRNINIEIELGQLTAFCDFNADAC